MAADEAHRDVDALPLAAGEGRGRQRPETVWQVQPIERVARQPLRRVAASLPRRLDDEIECAHAGNDGEELADIADRAPPGREDGARRAGRDVGLIATSCRRRIRPRSAR